MNGGQECDYEKWRISVVFCDNDIRAQRLTQSWWRLLSLTNRNLWLSNFIVSCFPLSINPIRNHKLNWDIYTPCSGAARILLHVNGSFTMVKLKSFVLDKQTIITCPYYMPYSHICFRFYNTPTFLNDKRYV